MNSRKMPFLGSVATISLLGLVTGDWDNPSTAVMPTTGTKTDDDCRSSLLCHADEPLCLRPYSCSAAVDDGR